MPRRVTVDVGLLAHDRLQYDMRDDKDVDASIAAWKAYADASPKSEPGDLPGDAPDRENAARCKEILATVGLSDLMEGKGAVNLGPLHDRGLAEDSAQYIAAHWLGAYNRMLNTRQKLLAGDSDPDTIGMMLMHAQEMGRLQERMWWRAGIDPQTSKKREALAVAKRKQEAAIPKASEARRVQSLDAKPEWHDDAVLDARNIRAKHPSYSRWRIAGEIHGKYEVSRDRCDKVLRANGID